jgi:V/A-type H+-transporting ATPase subunit I
LVSGFQGLVTTYGQPNYDELDPTPILALTFPLIFGIMFGDVGHGLLLLLVGLLLISRKIRSLQSMAGVGMVVVACGTMAMVFGFLYGSLFGFEDVLKAVWMRPLENIMDILLFTVAVGVVLLSIGMVYNMINAALAKHWGHLIFNRNGMAGLVFFWSILGIVMNTFGVAIPIPGSVLAILLVVSGIALTFAELFEHLVENHRPLVEDGLSTYIVLSLFELFETLISLFSNTLSYVRMGAFAVAHGALSLVVFIIAEIAGGKGSFGYWIVVILGNLFVIGFEGMIVGIQTLRLEYYEFFSKFFYGGGVPYQPLSLISKSEG